MAEAPVEPVEIDARLAADPMITAVRGLPDHFDAGWRAAADVAQDWRGDIDRIVVAGLGGSAFPADLAALAVQCPITVSRDYRIHARLDSRVLVIASSFSGNTEETLAAFRDAGKRGARRLALTGGGRLAEDAVAERVSVVRLSKPFPAFQPRAATAMFVGALARVCQNLGLASGVEPRLERVAARIRAESGDDLRQSRIWRHAAEIADALHGRIPVVLATAPFGRSVARIIKIKLNENAKIAAFWNTIPEFNHNELVGFTERHGPFSVVMLRDPDADARMRSRVDQTERTLVQHGVPVIGVDLTGAEPLSKAFAALYLFDFVSCRLALAAGIDPNPVALIESFKASLGPYRPPAD